MRISRQLTLSVTGLFHKMWRGHNREFVLNAQQEKQQYLQDLCDTKKAAACQMVLWYAFCIMGNHVHEVGQLTPDKNNCFSNAIKCFGNWMRNAHSRFGAWYNKEHNRQGKVAYDRPKTQEIGDYDGLLRVVFYLDCNPVRAGLVKHPTQYKYSTCRFYALGDKNAFTKHIDVGDWYLDLGNCAKTRQKKYRSLLDAYMREYGLIEDTIIWTANFIGTDFWIEKRSNILSLEKQKLKSSTGPP